MEAQACGTPVIAYGAGGTQETVRDIHRYPEGPTGILFTHQAEAEIVQAVQKFEAQHQAFCPDSIRAHAQTFDTDRFHRDYQTTVERCYQRFQSGTVVEQVPTSKFATEDSL